MKLECPLGERWLGMIDSFVREYARIQGFSGELVDMIVCSVLESCEELVRVTKERKPGMMFEVVLDATPELLRAQVIYDGSIPLDPRQARTYEKPSGEHEIDELTVDALWLHLVRARMDKAFFKVRGSARVLEMVKYRRSEGRAREMWVMGLSPRLKSGLEIHFDRDESGAIRGGVLNDPEGDALIRLDKGGAFIVSRLDGRRSIKDIYLECIDALGMISPRHLVAVFEKLDESKMLETVESGRNTSVISKLLNRMTKPGISFSGGDRLVSVMYRWLRPLFTPFGLSACLLAGVSGLIPLLAFGDTFVDVARDLFSFLALNPIYLLEIYVLMFLMLGLHELAHGLACRHYGGKVGRMGVMFYLGAFMFYCDTSAAWNFPSRVARVVVSLAGPLCTFVFMGVCAWGFGVAAVAESGQVLPMGALVIVCALTLLMNMNPFVKMDAYYVLVDLTGIPDLRSRAFGSIKEIFVETDRKEPVAVIGRTRLLLGAYGILGGMVSVLLLALPLAYFGYLLTTQKASGRIVVLAVLVIGFTLLRIAREAFRQWVSLRCREYRL